MMPCLRALDNPVKLGYNTYMTTNETISNDAATIALALTELRELAQRWQRRNQAAADAAAVQGGLDALNTYISYGGRNPDMYVQDLADTGALTLEQAISVLNTWYGEEG